MKVDVAVRVFVWFGLAFMCIFLSCIFLWKFLLLIYSCGASQYTLLFEHLFFCKVLTKNICVFADIKVQKNFGAYFANKTKCSSNHVHTVRPHSQPDEYFRAKTLKRKKKYKTR